MMGASTIYGGGALWLANQNGVMACVDPRIGVVRAQEHLADALAADVELLAVDAAIGSAVRHRRRRLGSHHPAAGLLGLRVPVRSTTGRGGGTGDNLVRVAERENW